MEFTGFSEYLDYLVAWIDAPLLDKSDIYQIFDIPGLAQFICHTSMRKAAGEAPVIVSQLHVSMVIWRGSQVGSPM
jgi:hypothetical protein